MMQAVQFPNATCGGVPLGELSIDEVLVKIHVGTDEGVVEFNCPVCKTHVEVQISGKEADDLLAAGAEFEKVGLSVKSN